MNSWWTESLQACRYCGLQILLKGLCQLNFACRRARFRKDVPDHAAFRLSGCGLGRVFLIMPHSGLCRLRLRRAGTLARRR